MKDLRPPLTILCGIVSVVIGFIFLTSGPMPPDERNILAIIMFAAIALGLAL